jgi:hypothetical protein
LSVLRGYTPGVFAKSAQFVEWKRVAARSCFWKSERVCNSLIAGGLENAPVFGRARERAEGNEVKR